MGAESRLRDVGVTTDALTPALCYGRMRPFPFGSLSDAEALALPAAMVGETEGREGFGGQFLGLLGEWGLLHKVYFDGAVVRFGVQFFVG